ncbi:programmed cell death protein 7-like isoform X2 [Patiria miniata]|uniref:Programmed cell death 7 n=1 Tax=Patiria miniata TaxID=46514 RepID=A0A914BQL2_PATMI|nr:programmed cell death protein 7-like isoform X2 [Patiria miniata]
MDENERRRTFRPPEHAEWSQHQEPNFTIQRTQHPQHQSGPSVNNQHLDQFLSGIRVEREREKSDNANVNTVGKIHMPMDASTRILQGTSPPGPSLPTSGPRFCSQLPFPVVNSNRPPFWQNPPPVIVKSQREQGPSHQSENSQSHWNRPDVARNVVNQDAQISLRKAEAFPPVTHHPQMLGEEGQQFPRPQFPPDNSFGQSQHFRRHHEPHPSGPHPSGPHPPGSSLSVQQPNGPHPSGQHPPGSHRFGQHPPEPHPAEPYQSALHQSGPRPFGPPGRLREPPQLPQAQSFHPHQQQQVQNRPRTFQGPRPLEPHPAGPRPPEPQFPPMPPAPALQQQLQQEGVTAGPFSGPDLNHPAPPSHQPFQRHGFPEPHPFPHPQAPKHEKSQREKDEEWVTGWLRKRKIGQSEKAREMKQKPITLEEGRQLVRDLLMALRQLKEQTDMLDRHINKDESSWQYECRRANRTKERVETLKARLFSKEATDQLENKMKKARKKRARLKRQRLEKHQMQEDVQTRRKEIHLRIDAELAKRLHAEQEKKREAELQEEVDKTLYEVRKKKQEVSQALELIKGLRKLRHLRKEAAQAKGVFTPRDSDISFDEKLRPLEELMSKQSVLYREEERVMQVMLEEEHEEYKEQEKKRQKKRLEEKAIKDKQAKMKLLFGKDDLVRPDDPMYPFQQFYTQAENNIHALVDIRHQWDQFLVPAEDPEGSAVPVSWVLPSEPSGEAWAAVLDS